MSLNRRKFIKATALAAGAATFGIPAFLRGQNLNSKLNIATIGAGGKGGSDTDYCAGENIVALCDVDKVRCTETVKKYPNAKFFTDYRKLLEEMDKSIDAVIVATPDHFHAIAAGAAIKHGKHIYCQKPLTQTIAEARQLRDLVHKHKVISQMGNQGSAEDGLRRAVEVIQAGVIGPVREVHVWSNRPFWPQGIPRPEGSDPVPDTLDWDLWIGPAQMRPYKKGVYAPWNWRGWLDFGTGALGDMACHTVNMPFRALQLGYPEVIEAESSGMNGETYPLASKIRFEFPARGGSGSTSRDSAKGSQLLLARNEHSQGIAMPPAKLWWYDGGKLDTTGTSRGGHDGSNKPPKEVTDDIAAFQGEVPGSGCVIIGDNGKIFSPDDYGAQFFIKLNGEEKFSFYKKHSAAVAVAQTLPRNTFKGDADARQHLEWIDAIKQGKPELCYSRFDITAYLTEIMLLGCVALRVGKKLEWDGPAMRAKNVPEAARFVKRENRSGWTV